jgi:hypothetical protein
LTATSTPNAPTGTPSNGEGPNEVIEAWPVPHPNPAYFSVHVAGSCDRVQISFYTRAMACIAKSEAPGRSGEGWVTVPVPVELYASANGTYHYAVQSYRSGQGSLKAKKGNLLILK